MFSYGQLLIIFVWDKGMDTIKRIEIAQEIGISRSWLSEILNGKREFGKATAKKFGSFTGRPWVDFLTMTPEQIEAILKTAMADSEHPAA
jgi:transcriptional regulator with XRE-family HTH domain